MRLAEFAAFVAEVSAAATGRERMGGRVTLAIDLGRYFTIPVPYDVAARLADLMRRGGAGLQVRVTIETIGPDQ